MWIIDRALTNLSMSEGWPYLWGLDSISGCTNKTAAYYANEIPHSELQPGMLDEYCCTQRSVATQCAALTELKLNKRPSALPAVAAMCLLLFLGLELATRRSFGWR